MPFAYDESMETVLFLLLFYFTNSNPKMKETLHSFLSFYRENRDLLTTFMQNAAPMPENNSSDSPKKEKNRPHEEVGRHAVLEEYLSRLA